ncbi:MAG TPA: hypothetical protein VFW31_05665 [Candidatus Angelobacter sp.]|nr:hypothetical protein [Candidatus Angelobacter sp.]
MAVVAEVGSGPDHKTNRTPDGASARGNQRQEFRTPDQADIADS